MIPSLRGHDAGDGVSIASKQEGKLWAAYCKLTD